jgi:hypothetical protein
MKLRLWRRLAEPEPEPVESAPAPPAPEEEPPARLSLTLDEAKEAIRAARGDVIQVGFLAGEYKRQQEEDPESRETAAARAQLCELIAKRLRDRKLLSPEGVFELRD